MKLSHISSESSIQTCYDEYIRYCEVRNLSRATILYYKDSYRRFAEFIDTSQAVSAITPNTISEYVIYIRNNKKINDISAQTYIRAIRAFCYYLMSERYIDRFKINLPKAVEKIKTTYSTAELKRLLQKPNTKRCSFVEFRTWVYVNYLLSTGNRLSSALNLKIEDIDLTNGYITLHTTKNKTEQVIPLSASLARVLQDYLSIRGGKPSDYLFCNDKGGKLSSEGLKSALDRYCTQRNVTPRGSHALRHSFAKMYLMNGGDVFRLQKLLGHKDISVTRKYLDLLPEDLKQGYDELNPLDTLTRNKDKIRMR